MLLSRTVVLFVVVLALGIIAVLGTVSSASPKGNDEHNASEERNTLTVLTKTRQEKVVDLGPQGPSQGDMRVVNAPLYDENAKERIGRFDLFCVTTDPADEPNEKAHIVECTYTYTLPGGEISGQGANAHPKLSEPAPRVVTAVIGGTGKYVGVRGELETQTRGNKVISTFHLID